ncbi:MAG: septum formation protein Maf [Bacteroidales bacterium]|nr:septum formation protein Maf [Bacteroidales bacterium]
MLDNLKKYRILLASASPRRRELLAGLGLPFTVIRPEGVDESWPEGLQGAEIPEYIARSKAEACRATLQADELLITADTIVWLDGRVLGKPADEREAVEMLQALSGRTHQVYTGVCLTTTACQRCFSAVSHVRFASLTDDEIRYYVGHYHPFDKAGAYGVQEWIGMVGVEYIEGSYFNVMGLPVQRLYSELKLII